MVTTWPEVSDYLVNVLLRVRGYYTNARVVFFISAVYKSAHVSHKTITWYLEPYIIWTLRFLHVDFLSTIKYITQPYAGAIV